MPYSESHVENEEKFLVTGANGQLGHALQRELGGEEGLAMPRAREAVDISDTESIAEWLPSVRPDVVINCAGYTNVSLAEEQQEECWAANVLGVDNLARVCSQEDIPLFHISTDFVYGQDFARCSSNASLANQKGKSGKRRRKDPLLEAELHRGELMDTFAYSEECPIGPLGAYAVSKAAGEHAILQHAADNPEFRYYIVRTSGLFERPWRLGRNFPFAIARRLLAGKATAPVPVVNDVFTNITYVEHLIQALIWMATNRDEFSTETGPLCPKGIYHIANQGVVSWYEVASRIAMKMGTVAGVIPTSRVQFAESTGTDYKTKPAYTGMRLLKYDDLCGPDMPDWKQAVDQWCNLATDYFK